MVEELWAFFANYPGTNNFTDCPVTDKSDYGPQHSLDQWQMAFDNLLGYILSISMCKQNLITIFHSVQETGPFSLFHNLELGKTSTDDKCHFAISWARSCQYQRVCKNLSKYSKLFKRCGHFSQTFWDTNWPGTDKGDYKAHWKSNFSFSVSWLFPGCAIFLWI